MPEAQQHFPHLKNAPIVEALIDFRVRLPADYQVERLKEAHNQIRERYPLVEEQKFIAHELKHSPGNPPQLLASQQGLIGFFFRSQDQKNLAQFRRDGFTFNRLHPYTSWDDIFPEAASLWKLYASVAAPDEISRIAIRYINRIQLPLPNLELSHYLTAEPPLPKGVPQNIAGFLTKVAIHDPDTNIDANVIQVLEPPLNEKYISMILDVDVYQANVSQLPPDAVISHFAKLREMKNRIFFGSLTEKAIAMFQ